MLNGTVNRVGIWSGTLAIVAFPYDWIEQPKYRQSMEI